MHSYLIPLQLSSALYVTTDMPGFVVDNIPSSLIRAFSEGWHREAFLEGRVRMKHIRQFQKSADAREDSTEGHSYIRVPGRVPVAHIALSTLEISGRRLRRWPL